MGYKMLKLVMWPWPLPFEGQFVTDQCDFR